MRFGEFKHAQPDAAGAGSEGVHTQRWICFGNVLVVLIRPEGTISNAFASNTNKCNTMKRAAMQPKIVQLTAIRYSTRR